MTTATSGEDPTYTDATGVPDVVDAIHRDGGRDADGRDRRLTLALRADFSVLAEMRARVRSWLTAMGAAACEDETVLATQELVANAVEHGAPDADGRVWLLIRLTDEPREVRIAVRDGEGTGVPVARDTRCTAESGRGLAVVSALARSWGVLHRPRGKEVWATLACAPAGG
ncbi:ATP-binding protein [Streptomyces sp. NPDC086091]|uniref:ATP-binding protein n=1 Tax=Streptomyces sp. NPDC086091 TaxID=3365751 RepID=UPI0037F62897